MVVFADFGQDIEGLFPRTILDEGVDKVVLCHKLKSRLSTCVNQLQPRLEVLHGDCGVSERPDQSTPADERLANQMRVTDRLINQDSLVDTSHGLSQLTALRSTPDSSLAKVRVSAWIASS